MPYILYNRVDRTPVFFAGKGGLFAEKRQPQRFIFSLRQNGDFVMSTYSMTVAGLQRELPICKVTDDLYIGAFICFGDGQL